jgi:hypothetical protein
MKWLKDLWNRIVSSNDEQYINKIAELEIIIKQQKDAYNELEDKLNDEIDNYLFMKSQYELMQETKNELLEELEKYKEQPKPEYITPNFLDTSKFPYLPNWLVYYYKNGIQTKSVPFTPSKFYRIWSDEMYNYFRKEIKRIKSFDKKVEKLRDVIVDITKYETDVIRTGKAGENWRTPVETYYGGLGDCEDTTILWVTACNICDISPERVFNATGYLDQFNKKIGHSFGLAKFDDGKWYVIETTSKRKPHKFKGSKYTIPRKSILNGLTNWEFSGESKEDQF